MRCMTYVHEGSLEKVAQALQTVLTSSGWSETETLPAGKQHLTVRLIPGAEWTALETSSEEFLASPNPAAGEAHLQSVCGRLGCTGFLLSVYSELESVLLETDATGAIRISGFRDIGAETTDFHGIPFDGLSVLTFELNPFDVDILDFDDMPQIAAHLYEQLTGPETESRTLLFARE